MTVTAHNVEEAVRRIVSETHPRRVILFGSAARGTTGPGSDIDLLLVVPDGSDCLEVAYRAHRRLRGLGCPADIVVVSESEAAILRDEPSLVVHTALTEGREVYRAA